MEDVAADVFDVFYVPWERGVDAGDADGRRTAGHGGCRDHVATCAVYDLDGRD